jgi:hypothetical protein
MFGNYRYFQVLETAKNSTSKNISGLYIKWAATKPIYAWSITLWNMEFSERNNKNNITSLFKELKTKSMLVIYGSN